VELILNSTLTPDPLLSKTLPTHMYVKYYVYMKSIKTVFFKKIPTSPDLTTELRIQHSAEDDSTHCAEQLASW